MSDGLSTLMHIKEDYLTKSFEAYRKGLVSIVLAVLMNYSLLIEPRDD